MAQKRREGGSSCGRRPPHPSLPYRPSGGVQWRGGNLQRSTPTPGRPGLQRAIRRGGATTLPASATRQTTGAMVEVLRDQVADQVVCRAAVSIDVSLGDALDHAFCFVRTPLEMSSKATSAASSSPKAPPEVVSSRGRSVCLASASSRDSKRRLTRTLGGGEALTPTDVQRVSRRHPSGAARRKYPPPVELNRTVWLDVQEEVASRTLPGADDATGPLRRFGFQVLEAVSLVPPGGGTTTRDRGRIVVRGRRSALPPFASVRRSREVRPNLAVRVLDKAEACTKVNAPLTDPPVSERYSKRGMLRTVGRRTDSHSLVLVGTGPSLRHLLGRGCCRGARLSAHGYLQGGAARRAAVVSGRSRASAANTLPLVRCLSGHREVMLAA